MTRANVALTPATVSTAGHAPIRLANGWDTREPAEVDGAQGRRGSRAHRAQPLPPGYDAGRRQHHTAERTDLVSRATR